MSEYKHDDLNDVSYDDAWPSLSPEQHNLMRAWYEQVSKAHREEEELKQNSSFIRSWHASLFALTPFGALFALNITGRELGVRNILFTILGWLVCVIVFSFLRVFYEKFGEKARSVYDKPSTLLFLAVELVFCVFASCLIVGLFKSSFTY